MTRLEFMKELESLLLDIPFDERNEALAYYNGYFDDAGEEQEAEIVKELGSPEKVAAIIKADLNINATDRESKGFYTETGYQETIGSEYEIAKSENNQSDQKQSNQSNNDQYNQNHAGARYQNNTSYGNYYNNNNGPNPGYSNYNNSQQGNRKSGSSNVLAIILAIVTFPIWLPIVLTVLGIAIGVIAAAIGILFGFGVAGVALIGSGLVLFVAGLAELATPFYGLIMMGGGLVSLGIGMLITLAVGFVCKKGIPVLINGFVNLCRLPFKNRRAMA